jgi:hypothetical protein
LKIVDPVETATPLFTMKNMRGRKKKIKNDRRLKEIFTTKVTKEHEEINFL